MFKAKTLTAVALLLAVLSLIAVAGFGSAKAKADGKSVVTFNEGQGQLGGAIAVLPTPAPIASPSSGRLKIGISYGNSLMWSNDQDLAAALDDAVKLGAGWVRLDLAWDDIQPDNAYTYDWS